MNSSTHRNGWVPEPDVEERGTASIIYTCFFTIYACTWAALHLNVPRRNLSHLGRLLRKIQWMILAVLAPEYISLTALVQRSSTVSALSLNWPLQAESRVLAYYALMGGFELHFDDDAYHRLKFSEFQGLVRAGFIDAPDITAEEVTDKSKGNWFTKSLALLQIGWYVLQLLGRVAQGLQTTPLELFTLGTVACTIVTYINWWAKPLDVNVSTAMSMGSTRNLSKQAFFAPLETYRLEDTDSGSKFQLWLEGLRNFVPSSLSHLVDEYQASGILSSDLQVDFYDDRGLPTFLGLHLRKEPLDVIELLGASSKLTAPDLAGWEINRDGIAALRSIDRSVSRIDVKRYGRRRDYYNFLGKKTSQPIVDGQRPEGFWSDALFEDRSIHTSSSVGLGVTTIVFGACHLLAWNYGFPSEAERILWRVMSIACTVIPMLQLVVDMSPTWLVGKKRQATSIPEKTSRLESATNHSGREQHVRSHWFARFGTAILSAITSAIASYACSMIVQHTYLILRIYLVVAIFISFRSVPESVYKTVDWSVYIPHFG